MKPKANGQQPWASRYTRRMGVGRDIAYGVGAVALSPVWGAYLLKTGKWRTDWPGRFGRAAAPAKRPGTRRLLIHAVSVGEVNATRTLVDQLAAADPALELVIATTTNTGFARAASLYAEHPRVAAVVRFPFDFTWAVRRLLDAVRPDAVALVELEVWPNFVGACARRAIPVCVVNGRLSESSFRGYRRIRPLIAPAFAKLAAVGAQTMAYADRFIAMGTPRERVLVLDTMKWDTARVEEPSDVEGAEALAAELGIDRDRPLIVAGSTGPGEERMLLDARPEQAQLLLVPRKPERFEEVAALAAMRRRTRPVAGGDDADADADEVADVFLLDTMGELRKAYALADVAVVGRSFNAMGGSDPIEPIALGKATIIGPDVDNFAEVVRAFEQEGGICKTDDLPGSMRALLNDPARRRDLAERGRGVIATRRGSTRRHVEMLTRVLDAAAA